MDGRLFYLSFFIFLFIFLIIFFFLRLVIIISDLFKNSFKSLRHCESQPFSVFKNTDTLVTGIVENSHAHEDIAIVDDVSVNQVSDAYKHEDG